MKTRTVHGLIDLRTNLTGIVGDLMKEEVDVIEVRAFGLDRQFKGTIKMTFEKAEESSDNN